MRAAGVTDGFTDSTSATSVVVSGLQIDANGGDEHINNGVSFDLRIAAESKDPSQDGSDSSRYRYSSWVTVSNNVPYDPLPAPTNLRVTPGSTRLDLSWTAPTGTVTGYDAHYTSASRTTVADDAAATAGTDAKAGWVADSRAGLGTRASHRIRRVVAGTAYRVRCGRRTPTALAPGCSGPVRRRCSACPPP